MTSPYISAHGWTAEHSGASVRLTARGRSLLLALAALIASVLLAVATASALSGVRSDAQPASAELAQPLGVALGAEGRAAPHLVAAGDTLWDLASALDPEADPRPLVDRIQQINGMSGSDLAIGSVLWLPVPAPAQHVGG